MENQKNVSMIGSLQVGLSIIDCVAAFEQPMKFTEILEATKITKSNLYKYLNTLTHLGFLNRDKKTGAYTLGSKMIEYGMTAIGQHDIMTKTAPYLQDIARTTGLSALLAVWTHNGPIIVNISNPNVGINIGGKIGSQLPILSSTGKVFATFLEESTIDEWFQIELQKITDDQKDYLFDEIIKIKEEQIAFAKEPLVSYISSASAPIFNYRRDLVATIGIVGFSQIIPTSKDEKFSTYLLEVASEISESFGYVRPAE